MHQPEEPLPNGAAGTWQRDLATLHEALWGRRIEHRPLSSTPARLPLVYGYTCVPERAVGKAGRLRKQTRRWCEGRDHVLGTVFVDWGSAPDSLERPGLGGLLGVLAQLGVHGVVVPTLDHLSPNPEVCELIRQRIARCGSHLIVMRSTGEQVQAHAEGG